MTPAAAEIWRTTVPALVGGFKDIQDAMLPGLAAVRISPDYDDDAFDEITTCLWEQVVVAALINSHELAATQATASSYGFTYETYRDKAFVGFQHNDAWVVLMRVMPAPGGLVGQQLDSDMRPSGREIAFVAGRLLDLVAVVPSQDRVQLHRELTIVL